jgi:hypothetical protein
MRTSVLALGLLPLVVAAPVAAAPRLALRADPERPRAGRAFTVRVVDRSHSGRLAVRVCLEPAAGRARCSRVHLGSNGATLHLRAPRPGRWTLRAEARDVAAARPLRVLPYRGRLSVLATGDSLVEAVGSNLTPALDGLAQVRTDALYASGISKPGVFDWVARTRRSAKRWHPDVVVVFIGGNEGFPFGSVRCCGNPWIAEFARRVRTAMRNLGRGGAAQVYWLALPAPRPSGHRRTWKAENVAFPLAARHLDPWTQVLDMSSIFTPGFVYRDAMPVNGELTTVREPDGIHLNDVGGAIAAQAVMQAMRTDGVLP